MDKVVNDHSGHQGMLLHRGCGKNTALSKRITTKQTGQLWEHLPTLWVSSQTLVAILESQGQAQSTHQQR